MTDYTVYRMEHSSCQTDAHHGPVTKGCVPSYSSPSFGMNGPTPQNDEPRLRVIESDRCGVLWDQVRWWWSGWSSKEPVYGWHFAVYGVPESAIQLARSQVVFDTAKAEFLGYFPGWVNEIGALDVRYKAADPVPDPPMLAAEPVITLEPEAQFSYGPSYSF